MNDGHLTECSPPGGIHGERATLNRCARGARSSNLEPGSLVDGPHAHHGEDEQSHADDQEPSVALAPCDPEGDSSDEYHQKELDEHASVGGRKDEVEHGEELLGGFSNHRNGGDVPVHFIGEGRQGRMRTRLAGPLLEVGSRVLAFAGRLRWLGYQPERWVGRATRRFAQIQLDVEGVERIDPEESYVVVALHEGFADALALLELPLGLRFAARDELFNWPALGRFLVAGGHPRVDTLSSVASVRRFYDQAQEVFSEGDSLVVFAQGSILGIEVAFQPGALRLARRFGRPLLPVVLTGSHRVWEHPYSPIMRTGQPISMRVLDPIPSQCLSGGRFRQLEQEMKQIALRADMAPVRRFEPDRDGWWDGYHYEIDPDFAHLAARLADRRRDRGGSAAVVGSISTDVICGDLPTEDAE